MKFFYVILLCPILTFSQSNQDITGVWKVVSNSWNADTKQYADCEIIKFITDTRWATIFYWDHNGKFAGSGGGTYEWIDNEYVETIDYFSWDTSAVGTTQSYQMIIQDGMLVQKGNINTDKYKYPLHTVHQKIDNLTNAKSTTESPQGAWQLVTASYGKQKYDKHAVSSNYERIIKIITPKYFLGAFFTIETKSFDGVTFGTHEISQDNYTETVICWSWDDQTMVGTQPNFKWEILPTGEYYQHGYLNSQKYKNYLIEEKFERVEKLTIDHPLIGHWLLVEGTYIDNYIKDPNGFQFKTFTDSHISTVMESENGVWDRMAFANYTINGNTYAENFIYSSEEEFVGLTSYWEYKIEWDKLIVVGPTKIIDKNGNEPPEYKKLYNTMREVRTRIKTNASDIRIWNEIDRANLLANLQRSRIEIEQLCEDLTPEQWHFNPSADEWSIAQVLEHITLYDQLVIQESYIAFNLPPRPDEYKFTKSDEYYLDWMGESKPHKAYPHAVPLGLITGKNNLSYFLNARSYLENLIKTTDKDLKAHFTPRSSETHYLRSIHGLITVHYGHTDRHIRQIKRIMQDQNYPK